MSSSGGTALIGPNAVLQLLPVLDESLGIEARRSLLAAAGLETVPDGTEMIDEAPVARLHQALRREVPEHAARIARDAGTATGDYVMTHRIPAPARAILKLMPAYLASRMLAKAIAKHAWTFAGSGTFRVVSLGPLVFEIVDNPVVRGERAEVPLCDWHAAVFERLYRRLVHDDYRAVETACAAAGDDACRFELRRQPDA